MEPTHSSSLSHIYLVVLVLKYEKPGKLTNVLMFLKNIPAIFYGASVSPIFVTAPEIVFVH